MHTLPKLLVDLAMVLGVAALIGLLVHRLRLPVVLGYVLAGMVVGPHVPVPLVADEGTVHTLAELGVTLLMFSIGLEFSLKRLFRAGPTALLMGSIQVGFAFFLGTVAARILGRSPAEALFVGAAIAISSTMVVAKLFEEQRPTQSVREAVFSVLVIQDLFAILLLTALTTFVRLGGLRPADLAGTLLHLAVFLTVALGLGLLVVPRALRWVADHTRSESLLIASAGLCFGCAVGAAKAGFSVALGAFLAGMLAAESGRARAIERLVLPLRDLFTAIFFVAVGMMLDPRLVWPQRGPILLLATVVILGNGLSLSVGGVLAGLSLRTSLRTGLALGQIGEFGYIILGTGIAAGVVSSELYTVGVAVGILTAFASPFLLRASGPLGEGLEARLPMRLRATLGVYQAWAESLRRRGIRRGEGRGLRRPALFLALDSFLLTGLAPAYGWVFARWTPWLERELHWGHQAVQLLLAAVCGLIAGGLVLGILRQGRLLALGLAILAPSPGAESGRRGRHLLAGGLRTAVLLMVGLPLIAAVQTFAPQGWPLIVGLLVFAGTIAVQLWRARGLSQDWPRGTEWLVERVRDPWVGGGPPNTAAHGTLRSLRLGSGCPCLGRRLADLDLPGRAGITVVALLRDGVAVSLHPSPALQEGDLLALVGSESALDEAEYVMGLME
jgi:CPA2 family monovalent cation:H+ antiporter-2